jgi:hypothetical protein
LEQKNELPDIRAVPKFNPLTAKRLTFTTPKIAVFQYSKIRIRHVDQPPHPSPKGTNMKGLTHLSILAVWLLASTGTLAAEPNSLDPHLEAFRPLIGKTWKGAFSNSTPEKPVADVMRWERALNGKAVRVLHSINDGAYGGETIFMWDEKQQTVGYHYFSTAGFITVGTLKFQDGKWITNEVVSGSSGGVTEVRGTSELLPDGAFHVKTEHLKDGKWDVGHEVKYGQDAAAKVVFK